jgi:molecular chaperone HscB
MQNFFRLFDIPESFDIDLEELDTRYFELQRLYHPDLSSDPNIGLLINEGYRKLQDSFERANHILELHGIFVTNDQLAPKLSPEKLENILEIIEKESNAIPDILESIARAFEEKDYTKAAEYTLELRYVEKGML